MTVVTTSIDPDNPPLEDPIATATDPDVSPATSLVPNTPEGEAPQQSVPQVPPQLWESPQIIPEDKEIKAWYQGLSGASKSRVDGAIAARRLATKLEEETEKAKEAGADAKQAKSDLEAAKKSAQEAAKEAEKKLAEDMWNAYGPKDKDGKPLERKSATKHKHVDAPKLAAEPPKATQVPVKPLR